MIYLRKQKKDLDFKGTIKYPPAPEKVAFLSAHGH